MGLEGRLRQISQAPADLRRGRLERLRPVGGVAQRDRPLVAAAMQCARTQGMSELADQIRVDLDPKVREQVERISHSTMLGLSNV